jgi:hypothetical protein
MDHNKDHDQDPESTVVPVNDDALEAVTGGKGIFYPPPPPPEPPLPKFAPPPPPPPPPAHW